MDGLLIDISDVAIDLARRRAAERGLTISALQFDLTGAELETVLGRVAAEFPDFDLSLVTCFHYLQRPLLASVAADLPPGVTFAAAIATMTNLEHNPRPPAQFCLQPGELRSLVAGPQPAERGLELLHYSEGWHGSSHHEAEIVVRKAR